MTIKSDALLSAIYDDTSVYLSSYQSKLVDKGVLHWPGQTPKQAASASLRKSLLKKLLPSRADELLANDRAIKKFLGCNSACASVDPKAPTMLLDIVVGEIKADLYDFWYRGDKTFALEGHPYDSLHRGRMGPGASNGVKGNDFYTKLFSAAITSTSPILIRMYKDYTSKFPLWRDAEKHRASVFGEPRIVDGSLLACVPKTSDISRVICIEPSLNMFYQLGFGTMLEARLKSYYNIDLALQPQYNSELARIGSITGQFSTIDLSSASDSISLNVLRELLPVSFMDTLMRYRSPVTRLQDGTDVPLHMVSSMGNGFTFPLQTILFASVVKACYKVLGLQEVAKQRLPEAKFPVNYGVFGDDIICLSQAFNLVTSTLRLLGFVTNNDKTFNVGPFRESCGSDFFSGINIRGVYVKDPSTAIANYVTFNRLNIFSARSGVRLPKSVMLLIKDVRYLPVPEWESDESGFRLPRFLLDKVHFDKNGSYIYYKNAVKPRYIVFAEESLSLPQFERKHPRIFNPDGVLASVVSGNISHGKIAVRTTVATYGRRRSVAPSWEMTDQDAAKAGVLTPRWRTACAINFG